VLRSELLLRQLGLLEFGQQLLPLVRTRSVDPVDVGTTSEPRQAPFLGRLPAFGKEKPNSYDATCRIEVGNPRLPDV